MTGCCSPRTDRELSGGVGGRLPADPRMRYPRIFLVDYEEEERKSETDESSEDTMELRCRKRQRLEHTAVNGPGALSPADGHTPSNFCYDDDTLVAEKSSTDGCMLFDFGQFKHNSGLKNDKLPKALKQSSITSPKNPAKNGWLSQRNGCRGILLSRSNGLTAPIFKVNGFAPVSNHVDACCRTSGSCSICTGGAVRHCGATKIADADDTAENLSSLAYLEPLEEKASQPSKSPDVVAGSRSERALDASDELLPTGIQSTDCFQQQQQPNDLRKFGVLCKETVGSSSLSSLSSVSSLSSTGIRREGARCQWNGCGKDVEFDALLEHIARAHIDCQAKGDPEGSKFVCLWNGCKFHGRGSVLKTWLERHIHCHLGDKPYRCIVAQCRLRFASQVLLNRHINRHFSGLQSRPLRKGDLQQKKKKLKNTRSCPVKKTDDFFDSATMESIQSELVRCAQVTQVNLLHSGSTITFQSCTMAKRVNSSGQQETLLRWWPKNMLPDEWVPESRVALHATRVVPLSGLPSGTLRSLVMPPQSHRIACHRRHPRGKSHRK